MKQVIMALMVVSLGISGCASLGNKGTGALVGAGAGGVAGGLISKEDPLLGAFIGAAAGALAGLAIGHVVDKMVKDADETAEVYGYKPGQGTLVQVETVRIAPALVKPGQQAKIIIEYAVLEGDLVNDIVVTEKRVIKTGDTALKEIGPNQNIRKPGTYSTEQRVVFPSSLSPGPYLLTGEVMANGKMSSKEAAFEVAETYGGSQGRGGSALQGARGFAN